LLDLLLITSIAFPADKWLLKILISSEDGSFGVMKRKPAKENA
jgi:hypothetical protein